MLIWIIKFGLIWRCNFCFWRSKYVIIADMSCCEKWSLHLPLIIFINTVVKISCQVWFAKLCLGSFAIINPNIVTYKHFYSGPCDFKRPSISTANSLNVFIIYQIQFEYWKIITLEFGSPNYGNNQIILISLFVF